MFFFRKKAEMVARDKALRGRPDPIPTARTHFLNGRELKGPYPDGVERALFGMGCFWGAERKFWELEDGIWITAVGYAAGFTPESDLRGGLLGQTGHNEVVLVAFDPAKLSYEELLKTFWESHDPTQGMRQGNDVGTQYRSGIYVYGPEQRAAADASKDCYHEALAAKRLRRDHHRDPGRASVLLRRGLSPAVPGEESRTATAASAAPASPARSERGLKRRSERPTFPSPRARGEGHARGVLSARREGRRQTPTQRKNLPLIPTFSP